MKPPRFEYLAPASVDEALEALSERGDEAKVLAGGQSLVPAMNLRLATPAALVDVNRIPGHDEVRADRGDLVLGMLVRHRALERAPADDAAARLLARTAPLVGHLPIRTRGTFAGSLAHADPAAEWCMAARLLDATVIAARPGGVRGIAAAEFFEGPFTTALAPDELVTEVRVPLVGRAGSAVVERSHTAGDFALVAAAALVRVSDDTVAEARLCLAGVESRPVRAPDLEAEAAGSAAAAGELDELADALAARLDPTTDVACSADYRRHLARVLSRRALHAALAEAVA